MSKWMAFLMSCSLFGGEMAQESELLKGVVCGRMDFFRATAVDSPLEGKDFFTTPEGSSYYSSGIDYAPCNGIMETSEREISAAEIDRALSFFGERHLPFIWWTSSKSLEAKGFQFGGALTGIALDISKGVPKKEISKDVQIKKVESEEEFKTFTDLMGSNFGMPSDCLESLTQHACAMKRGEQISYLALIDGKAVGTLTLSVFDDSSGIWNLGTSPEYRERGVATALVQTALLEAKKRGKEQVMAILMPKGMAWGLFTKMGFQEVCVYPFYVYGVNADELE